MTQKLHALTPRIRKHGGWVHRGVLLDAGWKPHQVLAVRRAEGIDLIRRQWLVLPDAPEEVREAARLGGVLTGVSALERLRLWVPPELTGGDRIHIGLRAGMQVVQQVWIAGKPVDALIGRRLVVQLDGYAFHSDSAQRRRDIAHDRTLIAMGYTVMRFSYQDVMHDWARVERELLSAIARGLAD